MSHDRDALITAYRMTNNCSHLQADRIIRGIELAYAQAQNAELQRALDEADGQHMKEISAYRKQIAVMERIMEAIPRTHMRFGIAHPDGTYEEPTQCADWCDACLFDHLNAKVDEMEANVALLRALKAHGVDNWDGYDEATQSLDS